ncbi:MAG: HAD-IA family hydrolase [Maricaulaceae bacterium]|jgi:phosphoglycolate phosphatase
MTARGDLVLAVWDVDGTLVDSRRSITKAMDAAFVAEGLPAPGFERTRQIVGLSLEAGIAQIAPPDISSPMLDKLVDAYKSAFIAQRESGDLDEPMFEGALETLERLSEAGWLQAVATGKARRGLDKVFERHPIGQHFLSVHTACAGHGKPHPRMVLEAMETAGVAPARTVVIGDTAHDMAMARNAGARGVGVSWGFHEAEEIEAGGAHELHADFASLNASLDRFAAGLEAAEIASGAGARDDVA